MEETSIVGGRRRIPLEVMKSFFSEKELDNLQNIAESGIMLRSELETFIYRVSDAFRIPIRLAYEEIRAFAEYTVTHFPFIFDNEYDELATDMGMCIEEVENSGC